MKEIKLLDTTIRDGELSPRFNPTPKERLYIAKSLESAGVDIIELASTAYDRERLNSSRDIAKHLKYSTVCCLSQLSNEDIVKALFLLDGVVHTRLHLYLDAKRVHKIENPANDCEAVFELINTIIGVAKTQFAEVEFSPQDATRVNAKTLSKIISIAINSGANIVNISDTIGTATPALIKNLLGELYENVPELSTVTLSLHAHDNLGRATENALAAIKSGAGQIEGTINSVGPAGGNTNLIAISEALQQPENSIIACARADLNRLRALGENTIFD